MDQIDLSDLFTTKAEANDFLSRLTTVSEMFFQTGFNLQKAMLDNFGVNKTDRFFTILRTNNINPESLPAVKDFVFILMSIISSLPVISLTVAFEPNAQTLKSLSEWFLINIHKQMLFDIFVDRNVIAGAKITYNGKFFDFSVRSTFERILENYMTRLAATAHPAIVPTNANQPQTQTQTQQQPVVHQPTQPVLQQSHQPIQQTTSTISVQK
jgi:hypothetical protein